MKTRVFATGQVQDPCEKERNQRRKTTRERERATEGKKCDFLSFYLSLGNLGPSPSDLNISKPLKYRILCHIQYPLF